MNFVQPLFKFNIVLLYRQHIDPCGLALSFNMYLLFTFQIPLVLLQGMANGIDNSAVFLLVSSQEYKDSTNCMRELKYADRQRKPILHASTG